MRLRKRAILALIAALALLVMPGVAQETNPPAASVPVFVQYTMSATATALCSSSILNNTAIPNRITVKNASGAANAVYLGGQLVANTPANAGVELAADQAYTFTRQAPCSIYIVGTVNAANIAFITAEY
jgi:hypothetical protein